MNRVDTILYQIHKGFMPKGTNITPQQILDNVPGDGLTPKLLPNGESILVLKPFTRKWVTKKVKKNPLVTAYDLLVAEGFKDES